MKSGIVSGGDFLPFGDFVVEQVEFNEDDSGLDGIQTTVDAEDRVVVLLGLTISRSNQRVIIA